MMLALIGNVVFQIRQLRLSDRKRAVTVLPARIPPFQGFMFSAPSDPGRRSSSRSSLDLALGYRIAPFQGETHTRMLAIKSTACLHDALPDHFRASYTKCPISGTMSFSIASCTAAVEPGIVRMMTLFSTPPMARLSIAAGPMSA